ncbi:MAG: hypothetical protein QG582_1159 [Candidatus Thermoplasmatota archaeon]|nr:hypothetical protein [Candidatus Thermoplasmatota archaeon]
MLATGRRKMTSGGNGKADGSNKDYLCRRGRNLIIAGVLLATVGALLLVMALATVMDATEGTDYMVFVMPQVMMMMIGGALIVTGLYHRHRYCK